MLGISSDSVREKLFYADGGEAKLTLPIAVDICKNSEMTVHLMQNVSVDASVHVPVHAMKSSVNLANKGLSRNTVETGRPLSKAKGNANIVGSLTKRVHALRGVETAIFAGGKITLLVCVHKTNQ